jgi:hypothetical protein
MKKLSVCMRLHSQITVVNAALEGQLDALPKTITFLHNLYILFFCLHLAYSLTKAAFQDTVNTRIQIISYDSHLH